jgi:hypothetical protein
MPRVSQEIECKLSLLVEEKQRFGVKVVLVVLALEIMP